jgi:Flp pilus assembly pilin Flp
MTLAYRFRHWRETHGQDMIEYALMAGFVAVAAGAVFPPVGNAISAIFSRVGSSLKTASTQGS